MDVNSTGGLVKKLQVGSVIRQLPSSFKSDISIDLNHKEINSLLGFASILSLSENAKDISQSYEVITRLLEFAGHNNRIIAAAELILSRIGNFPGRELLKQRFDSAKIAGSLKLECIARESENTIFIEDNSKLLTDFQYKFYNSLAGEETLSISAPTSAGKSFVLNLDLVRKIGSETSQSIVYLVPTRALISEVSHRIRSTLKKEGIEDVTIRSAPFPVAKEKIKRAAIYVFTQERLMSFLNSQDVKPYISSLIVDEAHEIQNGKRGIILQNAIDITLSRFRAVRLLFASPLISNPGYFLSLFERTSSGHFFVETVSPVSQNILCLKDLKGKPKKISITLLNENEEINIGEFEIDFKLRGSKVQQRTNLALAIASNNEAVISFSNGPSDAEDIACRLSKCMPHFECSNDIKIFIDFLKKEVHSDYPLIDCLLKGVAFHYGNMPSLVRQGVENLFKNGDIKIICCTSTLLQGVNLPAKHIIIDNPMSGDNNPMTRADFLNLAGRAGRLLHEFHGNIWCVRPSEWKSDCLSGEKLQKVSSAFNNVMDDGGRSIQSLLADNTLSESDKDKAEAAFGKLYHDYLMDPNLTFIDKYRNESNSEILNGTFDEIRKITITIPIEILENNQALRPDHLQALYEFLINSNLKEAIPLSPHVAGAKERMESIFQTIIICFNWEITERYFSWISFLSYQWVWGSPISKILSDRVNYMKNKGSSDSTSVIIRGCLSVLEDAVRFKLVKYFSAYIDILRFVFNQTDNGHLIEEIEPYHIYLEFGSCNRHALNLMALGLSRFSALYLEKKFDLSNDSESEDYLALLKMMNVNSLIMPMLCKKEIQELIN